MEIWTISDIHGYYDALVALLAKIGFVDENGYIFEEQDPRFPHDKYIVFLGDYIDRGHQPFEVIELIDTIRAHYPHVITLMGNHDSWLYRYVKGNDIKLTEERKETIEFIDNNQWKYAREFTYPTILDFYEGLPYHATLEVDGKTYSFAHAYYDAKAIGKPLRKQSLMLYGPVYNNEVDEKGFPNRVPWYEGYDGRHGKVIFGHYSLSNTISEFDNAVSVDCGVFKTGTLGAYEVLSGRKEYIHGNPITRE